MNEFEEINNYFKITYWILRIILYRDCEFKDDFRKRTLTTTRKLYIRRNNIKIDSIETGRRVIKAI